MEVKTCARCASAPPLQHPLPRPPRSAARSPRRRARPCRTSCSPGETLWSIAVGQQPDDPDRRRLQRPVRGQPGRARLRRSWSRPPSRATPRSTPASCPPIRPAAPATARRPPPRPAADVRPRPRRDRAPARAAGPLQGPRRATRSPALAASAGVPCRRDGRDERPRPDGAAADRHRAQAAQRRARAGPRLRARSRRRPSSRRPPRRRPRTRLGAADVQSVASQHGVSPSLAAAIAWQESGFNNAMVSSANARGVMQVMPGTWGYVQQNLAGRAARPELGDRQRPRRRAVPQAPARPTPAATSRAAIAGYYQGLGSVRSRGMFDDTKQYVANVQALRARFGG